MMLNAFYTATSMYRLGKCVQSEKLWFLKPREQRLGIGRPVPEQEYREAIYVAEAVVRSAEERV